MLRASEVRLPLSYAGQDKARRNMSDRVACARRLKADREQRQK